MRSHKHDELRRRSDSKTCPLNGHSTYRPCGRSQRADDMKEGAGHTPPPAVTPDAQLETEAFLERSPAGTPNCPAQRAAPLVLQSPNHSDSSWGRAHREKATFLNPGPPLGGVSESSPRGLKPRVGREWKPSFPGSAVHYCLAWASRPVHRRGGKMPGICRASELFGYGFGALISQGLHIGGRTIVTGS